MSLESVKAANRRMHALADAVGTLLVDGFHYLALFAIGAAVVWSAAVAFAGMWTKGHATIDDILLLFIYLELGAMVGIYFKTNHMPVRYLIYVAITALTRLLISEQVHHSADRMIVIASGSILVLALASLVIRYGSSRFPSKRAEDPA